MFNAELRAYCLAVLLLVFSFQWKQCVSTAEDFASDGSSVGDDYIPYSQQILPTENAPAGANSDYLDNYEQDVVENEGNVGKGTEYDTIDDEIEASSDSKKKEPEPKLFKDVEGAIIYGDTDGDIILKDFNDDQWQEVKEQFVASSTPVELTTTSTTPWTTTIAPTTSTMKSLVKEAVEDSVDSVEEFRAMGSRPNGFKDWLTSRKRRGHSAFEKYKEYHRNYHHYGHGGHRKAFGRFKKHGHHRSKHKGSRFHHQKNPHHSHFHYATFNEKPYYQGQVSYYGEDDDSVEEANGEDVGGEKSFHLPAKVLGYQNYGQFRRGSSTNRYRSDAYPNTSAKWPHLRRIEYQITKDERRERVVHDDETQLPPYIRKYNRRNKQLLDLLEGTTTTTTVAPSLVPAVVQYSDLDDAGGRRKTTSRKHAGNGDKRGHSHFHNHRNPKWIVEDLFEEQRANPNNPNIEDDQYLNDSVTPFKSTSKSGEAYGNSPFAFRDNSKGEDFSDEEDSDENFSKENENILSIQKNEFPSGSVADNSERPPKGTGGANGNFQFKLASPSHAFHSKVVKPVDDPVPSLSLNVSPTEELKISPKANQFIYHRVASPRSVGTGTNIIGVDGGSRKQRLPFVAITDRRLETSKMQKQPAEFRQNHLPLP